MNTPTLEDRIVAAHLEGARLGAREAMEAAFREEFRAFLDAYFDVMTKAEAAAFLGVSETTIEEFWRKQTIPKDTALGDRMPRTSLGELKKLIASGRIKARAVPPKFRAMPSHAQAA